MKPTLIESRVMRLAFVALAIVAAGLWPACSSTRSCRDGTIYLTVELGDTASSVHDLLVTISLDGVAQAPLTFLPQGRALGRSESIEIGLPKRASHPVVAASVVARSATGGELARASTPSAVMVTESCVSLTVEFENTDAGVGGSVSTGGHGGSSMGGMQGGGGSSGGVGGSNSGGVGGSNSGGAGGSHSGGAGGSGNGGASNGGSNATGGAASAGHGGVVATGGAATGGATGGKAGGGGQGGSSTSSTGGAAGGPGIGGGTGGQGNVGGGGTGGAASGGAGGGAAAPRCGDGIIQSNEQCDDANNSGSDGCASNCIMEPGFTCHGTPSVCTPVIACTQTSYPGGNWDRTNAMTTVILSVSVVSVQDLLAGAAIDGGTLLVMRGSCGSGGPILLYDGSIATGAYTGTDVTAGLAGLNLGEGRFSMAPDGLTVLSALPAGAFGVALRRRSSRSATMFAAVQTSDFANVNTWAAGKSAVIILPALSPDGLSLFFTATIAGTADSHYEVRRAQAGGVFDTPGAPIGGALIGFGAITSSSTDRLTIYADKNSRTDSFVRSSLTAPFVKQTTTQIPAIRVYPVDAGCHKLVGNSQPGGCPAEEIYVMSE